MTAVLVVALALWLVALHAFVTAVLVGLSGDGPRRSVAAARVLAVASATALGWTASWAVGTAPPGPDGGPGAVTDVVAVVVASVLGASALVAVAWVAPRRAASARPGSVAPLLPLQRVLSVLVAPVVVVADLLAALLGARRADERAAAGPSELAALVGDAHAAGSIDRSERALLAATLSLPQVTVAEVMAPRARLVTVPATATVAEAEDLVHRSGHSRVLVVGTAGEVTGFLHAKDLIALEPGTRDGLLPPDLVRVALRVDPGESLGSVLVRMRRARRHVAVVAAPDGDVAGLVTLEDVLDALVTAVARPADRPGTRPRRRYGRPRRTRTRSGQ